MRLLDLTIRNFRGFGAAVEVIRFGSDLILFYGPNGFGKTSLSEAIEWLLYGCTKRRSRGDQFSKAEYAGCYANVHGGGPTEVQASVRLGSREIVILRRLKNDNESVTYIDGREASFATIGLTAIEAIYPVIAQHGLQTFIHSKPKDRRDAISAALGLDELTAFKTSLESARSSFQKSPPRTVADARKELNALAAGLLDAPETIPVAKRWQKQPTEVSEEEDLAALIKAAKRLSSSKRSNIEEVIEDLRAKRAEVSKSVFDIAPFRVSTNESFPRRRVIGAAVRLERTLKKAMYETTRYLALVAASYKALLLEFWSTGLQLALDGDTCPMCESATLPAERRDELQRRIAGGTETLSSRESLIATLAQAQKESLLLDKALDALGVSGSITTTVRSRLEALLPGAHENITLLEDALTALSAARVAGKTLTDQVRGHVREYLKHLDGLEDISVLIDEHRRISQPIRLSARTTNDAFRTYEECFNALELLLTKKISSSDEVAKIDAVGKALSKDQEVRLLARYTHTLVSSQTLIRIVEGELQKRQNALLLTRGQEVKDFYDCLNSGADVTFDGMEPGTDSMKLHASSFGKRMSAAANLSECQLNCIGLATYLIRACSPGSSFDFILLDDPVQSMDDGHTEAFISDIVPRLLDKHGKQVIILSHAKKITDRLRQLNQGRDARLYHFEKYEHGGPTLTEQIGLKMLASEIRGAMKGNEANRAYAVDRIRVLTEAVIREIHLSAEGKPAPPIYDRAQAKELLPLFRTITGTTPNDHAGMQDTIRFCDPAHHTQVGYSVPVQSNIEPHLNRLETLMKKFKI